MALFKALTSQVSAIVKDGSHVVEKKSRIAKLGLKNLTEEEGLKKVYSEIGKLYYSEYGLHPGPGFEDLCDKVTEVRARIAENTARITAIRIDGVVDDEVAEPED
jgi:hypothetical protein